MRAPELWRATGPWRKGTIVGVAVLLLCCAFAIDALTPQTLAVCILYYIPIVLVAVTGNRRATLGLTIAAVICNVAAAFINASHDRFHWSLIGVENRIFGVPAVLLVGLLTVAVQTRSERLGRLAAVAAHAAELERLTRVLADQNEALIGRQRLIRDLIDALSHDLRTPLEALSVTLDQADNGAFGALPPAYTSVLQDSRLSIDDLRRLAETLLLVARFESADRRPDVDRVVLREIAGELISELRALAQSRGVTLALDAAGDPVVTGSRGDLRRALANLIANAIRYTPKGGRIDVRVAQHDGRAEVVVADDGYGVERGVEEMLFTRFARGANASVGTGLGLYIVRRIAEETGGDVTYAARVPRGSVFTLTLPMEDECLQLVR